MVIKVFKNQNYLENMKMEIIRYSTMRKIDNHNRISRINIFMKPI